MLACVAAGFVLSFVFSRLIPLTASWTPGTRTIILTILITTIVSIAAPVGEPGENGEGVADDGGR